MLWKRLNDGWKFEDAITTKKLNNKEILNKLKKKVYCNEINKIFNSIKEAEEYFININGKPIRGIARSCKSSYLKAGGYKWYYYQELESN